MIARLRFAPGDRGNIIFWTLVCLAALGVRLWGPFYFPTAEQDGYSDAETIARFSGELATGTLRFSHLYGFWLPLFQLLAAVPNIWMHNPLLAGQLLSAISGAASCVLACAVALRLTGSRPFSLLAFLIVMLSPMHLLYSSACMTDVPFGCLLLASLLLALHDQWGAAMAVGAIAGWVRVEAWVLVPLLPLLQLIKTKRVSIPGLAVLLLPPLLWLFVGQLARGDWFAFFKDRVVYHEHYMDFYPSRRGFDLAEMRGDLDLLMFGANRIVFLACLLAAGVLLARIRRVKDECWPAFATVACFGAVFAFLILGYLTKRQPVWLPRYGLFALVLGGPLLAWLGQVFLRTCRPRWLALVAIPGVVFFCAVEARSQYSVIPKVFVDYGAQSSVATALKNALRAGSEPEARCFSDDVAARVLSGLPRERLSQSHDVPATAWTDRAVFEQFLKRERVRYLVLTNTEDSLPAKWFIGQNGQSVPAADSLELIASAPSPFGPDVALYRVRD